MHIIIANPGNYSRQFEMNERPSEGQLLHLREKDSREPGKFYRVSTVAKVPLGLSGVFSFEVTLREIHKRDISDEDREITPIIVEEYNS